MKTLYTINAFHPMDYQAIQQYLEHKAQKGYILKKIGYFFKFQKERTAGFSLLRGFLSKNQLYFLLKISKKQKIIVPFVKKAAGNLSVVMTKCKYSVPNEVII